MLRIAVEAGADAVWFDIILLRRADYDELAAVAETGAGLLAGAVTFDYPERRGVTPTDTARAVASGQMEKASAVSKINSCVF